jgi:hypothetical protein
MYWRWTRSDDIDDDDDDDDDTNDDDDDDDELSTYLLLLVKSELFIFLPITPPPVTAPIDDPVELADVPVELDMTPEFRALSSCDQSTVGATTP